MQDGNANVKNELIQPSVVPGRISLMLYKTVKLGLAFYGRPVFVL